MDIKTKQETEYGPRPEDEQKLNEMNDGSEINGDVSL